LPDVQYTRVGPGRSFGCLGSILAVVILVAVVAGLVLLGVAILAVVAGLMIVGLLAVAVDRILLRLSPKRRERRAQRVRAMFHGPDVIDTTATLDRPDAGDPDQLS
jgi:hypothetical protein